MTRSDFEQAEHYSRQRARALPAFAVLLIVQQGAFMLGGGGEGRSAVISGVVWLFMTSIMQCAAEFSDLGAPGSSR